jgi:hypothetical protein
MPDQNLVVYWLKIATKDLKKLQFTNIFTNQAKES